jgi:hypothetical protein
MAEIQVKTGSRAGRRKQMRSRSGEGLKSGLAGAVSSPASGLRRRTGHINRVLCTIPKANKFITKENDRLIENRGNHGARVAFFHDSGEQRTTHCSICGTRDCT